jgi:hypothetical protein
VTRRACCARASWRDAPLLRPSSRTPCPASFATPTRQAARSCYTSAPPAANRGFTASYSQMGAGRGRGVARQCARGAAPRLRRAAGRQPRRQPRLGCSHRAQGTQSREGGSLSERVLAWGSARGLAGGQGEGSLIAARRRRCGAAAAAAAAPRARNIETPQTAGAARFGGRRQGGAQEGLCVAKRRQESDGRIGAVGAQYIWAGQGGGAAGMTLVARRRGEGVMPRPAPLWGVHKACSRGRSKGEGPPQQWPHAACSLGTPSATAGPGAARNRRRALTASDSSVKPRPAAARAA